MTPDPAPLIGPLARQLRRLYPRARVAAAASVAPPDAATASTGASLAARYAHDPVGYARDVLKIETLTEDQVAILRAFPGRIKVNAGHGTGKTFLAAVVVNWWFDTRDPAVVITTAPTERDVVDLLWTEVRLQRGRVNLADHFVGPRAPEMFDHDEHWAKGYTARSGESFQGRHRSSMLFIFDESEGITPIYWTTTSTMFKPGEDHAWLAIGNPVTTSSQSYLEDLAVDPRGNPKWTAFRLDSMRHPNVLAELAGLPPPVPNAVSLAQVDQWVADWTTPVPAEDRGPDDLEWPPASGRFVRPGPMFQGRVLGLRPSGGVDTVWSQSVFDACLQPRWDPRECWNRNFGVTIGVDPAAYGDDDSAVHVRSGPLSLYHEARNGWGPDRVAGRVKELCREWAGWYNAQASDPRVPLRADGVAVNIEFDGGYGVGVHSHRGDFPNWRGVSAGGVSDVADPDGRPMYANARSEWWFHAADAGRGGLVDLSRLPANVKAKLRLQLCTPYYEVKANGTRLVEAKKDVKKRLGRSPDDADAFLISHTSPPDWSPSVVTRGDRD